MSYILDALNKSDQERQIERAPNLKTRHVSSKTGRSVKGWKVVIFVLLMVNLLLLGMWLQAWMQADSGEQGAGYEPNVDSPVADEMAEDTLTETLDRGKDRLADLQSTAENNLAAVVTTKPAIPVQAVQSISTQDIPAIHELPAAMQSQIPALTFASHIYASNPRLRMVSINGRSMREGDGLSAELILLQITQEGVILQFKDTVFNMSVLRDWSF